MTNRFTESVVEDTALAWLEILGIAADKPGAEHSRPTYRDVVLKGRQAPVRVQCGVSASVIERPE